MEVDFASVEAMDFLGVEILGFVDEEAMGVRLGAEVDFSSVYDKVF